MAGTSQTAPDGRGASRSQDGRPDPATEAFLAHRNLLFTVAYEMLGSAADAEDVLQETWLRWAGVEVVSAAETRDALEAFQRAAETGDLQRLLDLLAPDVVFLGDGGGIAQAVLAPVVGADRVARVLAIGLDRIDATSLQPAQVNGYPALILRFDGEIDTVVALRIDDGLITGLYAVRNPEKLSHMERETALHR
jgi:hypothetical protein